MWVERGNAIALARKLPRHIHWATGSERLGTSCRRFRAWRDNQSEKDQDGLIEPNDILVVEPPDTLPELGLGHRRDLVHHQAARQTQAIVPVGLYEQSNERRVGLVGGEGTDGDRGG
jgi:hypothetical protein